ncbi:MAG TPA: hypothetical protein VG838_00655 [Opitutaceae bacterium]|nr:hypothetical protein [Opitutaceae bacterium]
MTTPMKTCANCICWRKTGSAPMARKIFDDSGTREVPKGDEGECREGPPIANHAWPLTHAGAWCRRHEAVPSAAVEVTPPPAPAAAVPQPKPEPPKPERRGFFARNRS